MKKVALIIMSILIAFNLIMPPDVAHANIVSKPVAIAAKKAFKELATDSAVEMAKHIAFEMAMNEFVNGPPSTEQGYEPVCLDGKSKKFEDCPMDKRAQVKKSLSATDKKTLAGTVEQLIDKKTNTDKRFNKFLDIFVPIFLVSGAIAWVSSALDSDSESLMNEIANDALKQVGLLKTLNEPIDVVDYDPYFSSASVVTGKCFFGECPTLKMTPKENLVLAYAKYSNGEYAGMGKYNMISGFTYEMRVDISGGYWTNPYRGVVKVSSIDLYRNDDIVAWIGKKDFTLIYPASSEADAGDIGNAKTKEFKQSFYDNSSLSASINNFFLQLSQWNDKLTFGITPKPVVIDINLHGLTPSTHTNHNNKDGTFNLPGQKSIPIKTPEGTRVFPKDDGTWTDTKGNPIDVNEDTLIVEDVSTGDTPPTDPGTPPGEDDGPPDKDKDKQKLEDESKKLGNIVTSRFPFSLPWDFMAMLKLLYAEPMTPKWVIDTSDTDIPLKFTIDLKFLDPYISWFRGFVLAGFVMSVIFMHGRFMGGAK